MFVSFTFCSINPANRDQRKFLHIVKNDYVDAFNLAIIFFTNPNQMQRLIAKKDLILSKDKSNTMKDNFTELSFSDEDLYLM